MESNFAKERIKDFFRTRTCFTFPRPVNDDRKLQNLSALTTEDFQPLFLKRSQELVMYVYEKSKPMWVGWSVTGNGKYPSV